MNRKKNQLWSIFLAFILSVIVFPIAFQAEGIDDPAPIIVPEEPNGKTVLFDNMHGQTAGQADWVIDGAFSDFAEGIAANGYQVKELRKERPFTIGDLEKSDVFVIPEANIPFKKTEQDAMVEYVENGGSIFFISDHYNADRNKNRWDSSEIMNGFRRGAYDDPTKGMSSLEENSEVMQGVESSDWLSDHFGIRFRFNAPGNIVADHVVEPSETFDITYGVSKVTMHAGSTLAITNPEIAKGILYLPDNLDESDKWGPAVDEGIYHGGGVEEGPYAAISKLGKGKAAFIGDSSPVEDATPKYRNEETGKKKRTYDGFIDADNGKLLLNTIDWLAEQESYETFTNADIPLDEPSPILDKEIPENTTEPQHEPWSTPLDTYHWFDSVTFAPGSFGSTEDPNPEPALTLNYDSVIPNDEPFTLEIIAEGLKPGQTINGYNLGIYLDGGQQIAKVQNDDGSWPKTFGYSEPFSLVADSSGKATKELTILVNGNVEGEAKIRLRQEKTNVLTKPVVVGKAGEDIEEPSQTISIKEARETADGQEVVVEGVITTNPGIFGGKGFYIQDDSAGIYVFQHEENFQVGNKVTITGTLTTFQGMKEITDVEKIEVNGKSELPTFSPVDQLDGSKQGERVTLEGEIDNIQSYWNAFEFDLRKDSQTTRVRIDNRTDITLEAFQERFQEGDNVAVSGIASIFKGTYQLLLVDLIHIEKLTSSSPVIEDISDFSTFEITKEYELPVVVHDPDGDLEDVTIELDGKKMKDYISISPLEYKPGSYEIKIIASDSAGNVVEESFPVEAVLSLKELDELVELGREQAYLDGKIEKRLLKKAKDVQTAKNENARNGKWNALMNQIHAQLGKEIKTDYIHFWDKPVDIK